MKTELFVKLQLKASHSLEENEAPHLHHWEIAVGLTGPVQMGRVISLPRVQSLFLESLKPLQEVYLNKSPLLDNASREIPTCENLGIFLWQRFSKVLSDQTDTESLHISTLEIGVNEPDGSQLGYARITL